MATMPQTQPSAADAALRPREIRIYGHTSLFYWWPVWLLGYIMALVTYINDSRLAIVPANSQYREHFSDTGDNVILLPQGQTVAHADKIKERGKFYERVHPDKNLGVIFTVVLCVVILITNVPLRGLSSAIAIGVILLIVVIFAWQDWWDKIFGWLGLLNIHMNMAFYVFFSTVLLVAWVLVVFVFDRMSYWRVTPDEITHEFVFGGGQKSFATEGMAFEKLRDDLFRHWVLGFGSGDMIMHPLVTAGAGREELAIHNVLFVGAKLRQIQGMIAAKPDEPTR
jgi:hypothetical protein